jgi:hypothetical protein
MRTGLRRTSRAPSEIVARVSAEDAEVYRVVMPLVCCVRTTCRPSRLMPGEFNLDAVCFGHPVPVSHPNSGAAGLTRWKILQRRARRKPIGKPIRIVRSERTCQ